MKSEPFHNSKAEFCSKFEGGLCPYVKKIVPKSWCVKVCRGAWMPGDTIQPQPGENIKRQGAEGRPISPKPEKTSQTPIKHLSLVSMAKSVLAAFVRAGKNSFKTVDEKTFVERQIACTTCGGAFRCPNCGCVIGIKGRLESERGCPTPQTYPGLEKYPPRNYWEVCGEKTTAIVIGRNEPAEWFNKTIGDLVTTATGKLEIIAVLDGYEKNILVTEHTENTEIKIIKNKSAVGRRKGINRAAGQASGDYLFIIDAHCRMSEGWDTRLKCACDENTIAVSRIKAMMPDFVNEKQGHNYGFVYINPDCKDKWLPGRPPEKGPLIEPMLGFTGCAWMIRREDFLRLGGFDESLGEYGYAGPEWALKIQLEAGGKVVLRKDVFCWHIFGTNTGGKLYQTSMLAMSEFKHAMMRRYGDPAIRRLAEKFFPLPEWDSARTMKTIICCTSGISDQAVVDYCLGELHKQPFDKCVIVEARRPEEPPSLRTYYAQLLRALDSPMGAKADYVYICEHDCLYHRSHFDFVPANKDTLYYDLAHARLDAAGFFRSGKYLISMLVAYRELLRRLLIKRIKAIDAGWDLRWGEPELDEPDGEQAPIIEFRAAAASVDIRHGKNFTGGQTGEHFMELAGWGKAADLWVKIRKNAS